MLMQPDMGTPYRSSTGMENVETEPTVTNSEVNDFADQLELKLNRANRSNLFSLESISKYVPLFISVLALVTSVYSAMQTRLHDRLSARPFIYFSRVLDAGANELGLFLANDGLGSATVSNMRVYFDEKRVNSFDEISEKILNMNILSQTTPGWDYDGSFDTVLRSGAVLKLYHTSRSNVQNVRSFRTIIRQRLFIIVYICSMYNECNYTCTNVGDNDCRKQEIRISPESANIVPIHRN